MQDNLGSTSEQRTETRRRISRRRAVTMLGGGAATLWLGGTLAGCGDDDDNTSPASSAGSPATSGVTAPATAKRIDSLTVAIPEEPPSFDVQRAFGGVYMHFMVNVFEGLLTRDTNNKIIPGLAESYTAAPDGKTFEFKLRKGVKFHNGDTFTAEDVAFSFTRFKNKNINPRQTLIDHWERLEVVDDYTVRMHLTTGDPTFVGFISTLYYFNIVPKKYLQTVGDDGFEKKPIGTGRYKFISRAVKEYWELESFDEHWSGPSVVKKIRFNVIPEPSTMAASLQSGNVAFAAGIAPQFASQFEGGDFKLIRVPASNTIDVRINTLLEKAPNGGVNPYRDVRVRKAMDLAVDRDAIIKNLLNGFGQAITGLFPEEPGNPSDLKPYPYDPTGAKRLLEEAGYANGFDATFWGLVGQRVPNAEQVGEAFAGYFSKVGIRTTVRNEEYAQWLKRSTPGQSRGTPDELWPFGLGITYIGGQFHPAYGFKFYAGTGGSTSWFSDSKLDDLVAKMYLPENQEPSRLNSLVGEAAKLAYDLHPVTLGYRNVTGYAFKKSLKYTPTTNSQYIEAWNIASA